MLSISYNTGINLAGLEANFCASRTDGSKISFLRALDCIRRLAKTECDFKCTTAFATCLDTVFCGGLRSRKHKPLCSVTRMYSERLLYALFVCTFNYKDWCA